MMDWKPEAIEAFKKELDGWSGNFDEALRAALDAAVEAQGITQTDLHAVLGYEAGHEAGRAEAFEEAAKVAEGSFPFDIETWLHSTKKEMTAHLGNAIATAIRALAKEPKKGDSQ